MREGGCCRGGVWAHREERIETSVLPLLSNDKLLKQTDPVCVKGGRKKQTAVHQPSGRQPLGRILAR
jgi:hypothetical protein